MELRGRSDVVEGPGLVVSALLPVGDGLLVAKKVWLAEPE